MSNFIRQFDAIIKPYAVLIIGAVALIIAFMGLPYLQQWRYERNAAVTQKRIEAAQQREQHAAGQAAVARVDLTQLNQRLSQIETNLKTLGEKLEQLETVRTQLRARTYAAQKTLARMRGLSDSEPALGAHAGAVSVADACAGAAALGYPCS